MNSAPVVSKGIIKPSAPKNANQPTEYHCYDSCNACVGVNAYEVTDSIDYRIMECETECKECGHKDYWAHGWFESGQEMESKCRTYSFKRFG